MSQTVSYAFRLERTYPARRSRVFRAWARADDKLKWFGAFPNFERVAYALDFRVGGVEHSAVRFPRVAGGDGVVHAYDAVYRDIVDDERVVLTYDMHAGDEQISASVLTVELSDVDAGTKLVLHEAGFHLNSATTSGRDSRESGTRALLELLAHALD